MNFFRKCLPFLLPLVLSGAILTGLAHVQNALSARSRAHKLRFNDISASAIPDDPGNGARAAVRFAQTALGSFRGVVADFLWLRAEKLKQEGRHSELVQLSRWIIDLQPTYASAVAYLGWNLAYNVSVTTSDFSERWRWICEGIALFKDRALVYNPEESEIYRELAWIYLHKIGNQMDDAQLYYKERLARSMMHTLGDAPDFAALAAAPAGEEEFFRVFRDRKEKLWRDDRNFSSFHRNLYDDFFARDPADFPETFLTDDPALRTELGNALRAERLRRTEKLDPRKMLEINRRYGELDWRVPESQAIYWASIGAGFARDKVPCERLVNQALDASFRAGKILFSEGGKQMLFIPNLDLGDAVLSSMEASQKNAGHAGSASAFRSERIYFLKQAIPLSFVYGQYSRAKRYYEQLVKEDGPQPDADDFESYVFSVWKSDVGANDVKRASTIVSGLIANAVRYLLARDAKAAVSSERLARHIHRYYTSISERSERTQLPPYDEMKSEITRAYMRSLPPAAAQILQTELDREAENGSSETSPEKTKE